MPIATYYDMTIHQGGMTMAWSLVINMAIIAATLRYDRVALIVHAVLGWTIFVISYTMILFLLAQYGFNVNLFDSWYWMVHGIVGCALVGFLLIQVAGGMACKTLHNTKSLEIKNLRLIRTSHKVLGYFIVIVYKALVLWAWHNYVTRMMYYLLIWEAFWIILFFFVKFGLPKMQKNITDSQTEYSVCPEIELSQISQVTENYLIFANYVYDARNLEQIHPGGHKVIQLCKGREVDRFIYGMYSVELYPELEPFSHSANSIQLAGTPVGKLTTPSTYEGIPLEINSGIIKMMNCLSQKTDIYSIGIIQESIPMRFLGYSDIRQLGQYYSLTINNKITRLYTAVNFLNETNIQRLAQLISVDGKRMIRQADQVSRNSEIQLPPMKISEIKERMMIREGPQSDYLPMMMKVYEGGKLTSALKAANFINMKVKFSCPRGRGLRLEELKAGKIVIVAGGTGLFPFSDLIDLLFKEQIIEKGGKMSQELLQADPLLKQKPFSKFDFVFLIAVNEPEDIHPITFSQLVRLSKNEKKFKIALRVSRNAEKLHETAGKIEFTKQYFTKRVLQESGSRDFSHALICGPPMMNTATAKTLEENGFRSQHNYHLV